MTIELFGMSSPNVVKVLIMLEETGLAYQFRYVEVVKGEQFAESFRALNPNSKVPVIVDSDGPEGTPFTIFESGAILMYLAEKTGRFWPTRPTARSRVAQWLMLQMGGIGPTFGQTIHFCRLEPNASEYASSRFKTEAHRLEGVLEDQLAKNDYLAGSEYSIADMAVFPWIRTMRTFSLTRSDTQRTNRWYSSIETRPAVKRALEATQDLRKLDRSSMTSATQDQKDRYYGRGKWAHSG